MDGLLLDTEPFYTEAAQKIVSQYGKTFPLSLKSKTMGRPAIESATFIVKNLDLPISGEEYLEKREKIMIDIFPHAKPKKGAKELTKTVFAKKIPQAVATSSSKRLFRLKTENHKQWFSNFTEIINGDDPEIEKGKPAPDIFLLAARKMGADPKNCLVFEDSPSGVMAGKSAGMKVVAVIEPYLDKNLVLGADQILHSLEEFKLEDWEL